MMNTSNKDHTHDTPTPFPSTDTTSYLTITTHNDKASVLSASAPGGLFYSTVLFRLTENPIFKSVSFTHPFTSVG